MQELERKTGRMPPDILPEATVTQIHCDARNECLGQPEQVQARQDLPSEWNSDKRKRTMVSRFRSMLKEKYGGKLWFQVLISTGTIPPLMLRLANLQLAQLTLQQKQHRAPASSRGPASAVPTGSQHVVSGQKRQRQVAKRLTRLVRVEDEKRSYSPSYGNRYDDYFVKLQKDAERATKKASDASRASGYAYTLDGQTHGAPETSNFAILLADYCGELNIDVRTGHRRR
jgi:hypothetical protein